MSASDEIVGGDKVRRSVGRFRNAVTRNRLQMRMRDLVLAAGSTNLWVIREDLARRYVPRGTGIEIGAMTKPQRVPPHARVLQVDRLSRDGLLEQDGPALAAAGDRPDKIVTIDRVDDAASLSTFDDGSLDFVIANHVLEHLEDPIESLCAMARVLRGDGVLLISLPDPRYTFDSRRARTSVAHLVRDHEGGPDVSRDDHYREWAELIEGVEPEGVEARAAEFKAQDARHHFHVWELPGFLELLRAVDLPVELIHAQAYHKEFAVVLRKRP